MCCYFDDITNGTKINFSNILLNKKLYETISISNILYKTPAGPKPLCIRFDEIDGFITSVDGKIKHLIFLIMDCLVKFVIRLNILEVKKVVLQIVLTIILERLELFHITPYLLKKILTFYTVIILIKSVVSKNENNTVIIYF